MSGNTSACRRLVLGNGAICVLSVAAILWGVSVAQATPTVVDAGPFTVTFHNNGDSTRWSTSENINSEKNWTAQEMSDVIACINTWDIGLLNVPGRQVQLHMVWSELDPYGTGVLGGSYSPTNGDGVSSWSYPEHVWRDGVNYNGLWDDWDCMIQYDITAAGYAWNIGTDSPTGSEIDFRSVVTHEIGHALGFSDSYDYSFDDWGNVYGSATSAGAWLGWEGLREWDKLLMDSAGNRPSSGGTGTPGNFNETDDPVYFTGPNSVDYFGGNVPIYAPYLFQPGSSLAHLDEDITGGGLMTPYIDLGEEIRAPTELEWQMMADMGWTIPEPATALLLVGGGAALLARRRRG